MNRTQSLPLVTSLQTIHHCESRASFTYERQRERHIQIPNQRKACFTFPRSLLPFLAVRHDTRDVTDKSLSSIEANILVPLP